MKLYVCWGTFATFGPGHPCRNALDALRAAGHDPEVIRSYGWGLLPASLNRSEGRRLARTATGKSWVPLLLTDEDDLIAGSIAIKEWASHHPADSSTSQAATRPQESSTVSPRSVREPSRE